MAAQTIVEPVGGDELPFQAPEIRKLDGRAAQRRAREGRDGQRLHAGSGQGNERHHVRRPDPGMLALVQPEIDAVPGHGNRGEHGLQHRLQVGARGPERLGQRLRRAAADLFQRMQLLARALRAAVHRRGELDAEGLQAGQRHLEREGVAPLGVFPELRAAFAAVIVREEQALLLPRGQLRFVLLQQVLDELQGEVRPDELAVPARAGEHGHVAQPEGYRVGCAGGGIEPGRPCLGAAALADCGCHAVSSSGVTEVGQRRGEEFPAPGGAARIEPSRIIPRSERKSVEAGKRGVERRLAGGAVLGWQGRLGRGEGAPQVLERLALVEPVDLPAGFADKVLAAANPATEDAPAAKKRWNIRPLPVLGMAAALIVIAILSVSLVRTNEKLNDYEQLVTAVLHSEGGMELTGSGKVETQIGAP